MPRETIHTIGHSDRTWEDFVETLRRYQIGFVVDLRSTPHSRRQQHFDKRVLEQLLPQEGFKYLHLGDALGARRTEPHLLSGAGQVLYPKVRQTEDFKAAIARIEKGADEGYRLALLCNEGDPFKCHTFPMIGYQLAHNGFDVRYIVRDGSLKSHKDLEAALIERYSKKIPHGGFFEPELSPADQLEAAYHQLNLAIGWPKGSRGSDSERRGDTTDGDE